MRMFREVKGPVRLAALTLLLGLTGAARPALAAPITLEFSGSIFGVTDPSDVFATTAPATYSLFLTYDPALLIGTDVGDFTVYEAAAGETSITFSFVSSGGDTFVSDNTFPTQISVRNTAPYLPLMLPGTGHDSFSIEGQFDAFNTLSLVLLESPGSNPLSSNALPTGAFGSGPGTWTVSELDIDRTDLFANISGSVANITQVTVPEPSALALYLSCGIALCGLQRRKTAPAASLRLSPRSFHHNSP